MHELSEDLAGDTDGQGHDYGEGTEASGEPGRPRPKPRAHDRSSAQQHKDVRPAPRPSEDRPPAPARKPFYTRPLLMAVLAVVVLGGATAGGRYWLHLRQYESTDDAFIQGHNPWLIAVVVSLATFME